MRTFLETMVIWIQGLRDKNRRNLWVTSLGESSALFTVGTPISENWTSRRVSNPISQTYIQLTRLETSFSGVWSKQTKLVGVEGEQAVSSHTVIITRCIVYIIPQHSTLFASQIWNYSLWPHLSPLSRHSFTTSSLSLQGGSPGGLRIKAGYNLRWAR